jgi:hypothetical protein
MACLAVLGLVACCQMGAAQESGRRLQIGMVLNGPSSGQGFATSPLTGLERAEHPELHPTPVEATAPTLPGAKTASQHAFSGRR